MVEKAIRATFHTLFTNRETRDRFAVGFNGASDGWEDRWWIDHIRLSSRHFYNERFNRIQVSNKEKNILIEIHPFQRKNSEFCSGSFSKKSCVAHGPTQLDNGDGVCVLWNQFFSATHIIFSFHCIL